LDVPLALWLAVAGGIVAALALDLFVLHRNAHEVSMREAAATSAGWVTLGLVFGLGVWLFAGADRGAEYFAGYLIEKSLSVDNVFVFALLFSYFAVPARYQHRVLFWGVVGALLMRAGFIAAGAALLESFHWIIYVFGGLLLLTGVKMLRSSGHSVDPARNPVLRLLRRRIPMVDAYHGQRFFVRRGGRWVATPMLAVLVAIESTDVVFAVDSIPAIFAVTDEPFLVFTSNAFAILGLRALYFLLAGMMGRFAYLKTGLAAILLFVGAKMLLTDVWKVPVALSLGVIAVILTVAVVASLRRPVANMPAHHEAGRAGHEVTPTPAGVVCSAIGGPADGHRQRSSSRERSGVDLPGQHRLGSQTQHEVALLAEGVVRPASDPSVLQPLVDAEAEEEEGLGDEDAVDEPRNLVGAEHVHRDRNPRSDPDEGAEPERDHGRGGAPRRVGPLLGPAEQDHADVRPGDGDHRSDVGDAGVGGDEQHHERRAERVLDPPEPVDAPAKIVLVGPASDRGRDEVVDRGQAEEDSDGHADPNVEEAVGARRWGTWRTLGEGRGERDGEIAGQQEDDHCLEGVEHRQPEVPASQIGQSLGGDPRCDDAQAGSG
jgi:tellurite resistance protein TerC